LRTVVAFWVILAMGRVWAAYAVWTLRNRRVLLANHRIVAGRIAVLFCMTFVIGACVAGATSGRRSMFRVACMGLTMLAVAVVQLVRAHQYQGRLLARRNQLQHELSATSATDQSAFTV
jgi:hypothetical protein